MCVMHTVAMFTEIDIKKLRQHRKWTQEKMGEHFGVDKATVWRWENEGIPARGVARKAIEREWESVQSEMGAAQ